MKALAFSGGKDSMACLFLLREELDCLIHVDTGYAYPETRAIVNDAARMVPTYVVMSNRDAQNTMEGIPSDVVPIDWTRFGQQFSGLKEVTIQSYLGCCFENINRPIWDKAIELGVTHLYFGQRQQESKRAPWKPGEIVFGIERLHPINDWTTDQVMGFLSQHMEIPKHYLIEHSSLDCYDCTAYRAHSHDRVAWTKERYPIFHQAYETRRAALDGALRTALEA